MPTKKKKKKKKKIEAILQPSNINLIAAQSTRETWKGIDQLIEILAPLFLSPDDSDAS